MATGTGNLPYPGKSYSPFDILTAEELNEDVANIESLADGTGIGDEALDGSVVLKDDSVTAIKTDFGGDYSTTEVNTGFKWIGGKDIYKKTVNFGALPNNTQKSVAHGITGLDYIIYYQAIASGSSGGVMLSIPDIDPSNTIRILPNQAGNINISTNSNRSTYSAYITLFYTKT